MVDFPLKSFVRNVPKDLIQFSTPDWEQIAEIKKGIYQTYLKDFKHVSMRSL